MEDKQSIGLNILSFLFPIIGWILYFVLRGQTPEKAKGCGVWGLIGFVAAFILQICVSA